MEVEEEDTGTTCAVLHVESRSLQWTRGSIKYELGRTTGESTTI